MSDSILFLLKRGVRSDTYPWVDEFQHIFWPTRLIWVKKGALGGLQIGGPLFGIHIKMKKGLSEFSDLLIKVKTKEKEKRKILKSEKKGNEQAQGCW